jgi:hypothetical protein
VIAASPLVGLGVLVMLALVSSQPAALPMMLASLMSGA